MKIRDIIYRQPLLEMPLAGMWKDFYKDKGEVSYYNDNEERFNDRDKRMLDDPIIYKKLDLVLNRIPFHFNLLFIDGDVRGDSSMGYYKLKVGNYIEQNNIQIHDHITFVKNKSSGEPLTTWMILHTIGHALGDNSRPFITRILSILQHYFIIHYKKAIETHPSDKVKLQIFDQTPEQLAQEDFRHSCTSFYSRIFKFRSAVNKFRPQIHEKFKLNSEQELVFELVAEYLHNGGKIRIANNLNQTLPYNNNMWAQAIQLTPELLRLLVQELEETITAALSACVNRIIYDVY